MSDADLDTVFPPLPPEILARAEAIKANRPPGFYLPPPVTVSERTMELGRRELEVLVLIADGLTNQEIADRLGIAKQTVETHVRGILRKFEVESRAAAVACGFRRGLLT